jgi:transcriptional regulator with XRE-family HTH domain
LGHKLPIFMPIKENIFLDKLGTRIRQLRELRKLSQENLANDCNIPKVQIGRIERAEINTTVRTLIKISNALEVQPKDLFNV